MIFPPTFTTQWTCCTTYTPPGRDSPLARPTIARHKCQEPPEDRWPLPVEAYSKLAIVARNPSVVPKQKRIEALPSGYAVRELCGDSEGHYWYVVIAFEFDRPAQTTNRT